MKLYSIYTQSHKIFVDDWFLPSLKDDFEVILETHSQQCLSAEFMKDGWLDTMLHKVDLIIRAIKENHDKLFIHCDVDIQFFRPAKEIILKLIKGKDMVIQRESSLGTVCPGFVAIRGSEKMARLWEGVKNRLAMGTNKKHDQDILNEILHYNGYFLSKVYRKLKIKNRTIYPNSYRISWSYLPITFFSPGIVNMKIWEPGQEIDIPKNIVLHHANWTVGAENKIAQLQYVRDRVNSE